MIAALALAAPTKGGPWVDPPRSDTDVVSLTVWDNDLVRGAASCADLVAYWAPAVCHVEPLWLQPLAVPGWARL